MLLGFRNLTNQLMCVAKHKSYQHLIALPVSLVAALDYKFSHISHCMDTSKCISASHFSDCLEYKFRVTSVTAWTPSRVLTALLFIGCLDYKFSHISYLPGRHQVYLHRCTSVAAWTKVFNISRCSSVAV
ncbi:hypothetical protein TNCV_3262701 [Trichonephila clavipes]|nr:hypothetical protein TNCV_3262701 [Trichonephila clavipes]